MFPSVVIHDAQTFDPIKVVSEYLRCDAEELNAFSTKNMNWPVIDGTNMRKNIGNKKLRNYQTTNGKHYINASPVNITAKMLI